MRTRTFFWNTNTTEPATKQLDVQCNEKKTIIHNYGISKQEVISAANIVGHDVKKIKDYLINKNSP